MKKTNTTRFITHPHQKHCSLFSALCSLLFALCSLSPAFAALSNHSANTPFSKYGQIQNVQNYSTNPFWNPNSPYNQKMPQAVYAQGADLTSGDCMRAVSSIISTYCGARDNCRGLTLSAVRPDITMQLAALPAHNYVVSCAGYIDSEFESYQDTHYSAAPTQRVAFPTATAANPNADGNNNGFEIKNPFQKQPTEWQMEYRERANELKELQAATGTNNAFVEKADFPTTYADLSFSERMENARIGYEPFKDMHAYREINIESLDEYCGRTQNQDKPQCKKSESNRGGGGGGRDDGNDGNDGKTCTTEELEAMLADLEKVTRCITHKTVYTDCINTISKEY